MSTFPFIAKATIAGGSISVSFKNILSFRGRILTETTGYQIQDFLGKTNLRAVESM